MLLADSHTHTSISPDGEGTVEQLLQQAEQIGLQTLTITEHVEMNRYFPQKYYEVEPRNEWEIFDHAQVLEKSFGAVEAARAIQPNSVRLLQGMEMGQPNADFALSASVAKDKRLDFIIASLHELSDREDFFSLDYTKENPNALLQQYFQELLEIAQWGQFDVLGHITYPLRYMIGEAGVEISMEKYLPQIAEIYRSVIAQGKGIELNVSGYRQKYGIPFPSPELLRLYKDLGGKVLTLGSDAHCAADLSKGIAQGQALAKSLGFTEICYFEKHNPIWVKL